MNASTPLPLLCSRRQLKIQGMLWLCIVAEISLMALLVRGVRSSPLLTASAANHPDAVTAKAFPAAPAPLLTSLR